MPHDNKKLISQINGLYDKFLLELQELEKKRQEILAAQGADSAQNYTNENTKQH